MYFNTHPKTIMNVLVRDAPSIVSLFLWANKKSKEEQDSKLMAHVCDFWLNPRKLKCSKVVTFARRKLKINDCMT